MTRSSGNNPASSIMSHLKHGRKNGSGGNYPQWMRTLEEKYQKLHKKIAENTSMGHGRFNSCVGRSVYDARLSQALLRYKDQAFQKSYARTKLTAKETVTNTNEQLNDLKQVERIDSNQNQYLDNDVSSHQDDNGEINCENIEPERFVTLDNDPVAPNGSEEEELYLKSVDNDSCDEDNEISANTDRTVKDDIVKEKSSATKHDIRKPDRTDNVPDNNNHHQYSRKNLKTSLSRTSKITSKSCPVKLPSKTFDKVQQKRLLASRSKSANRNEKMFTPMSAEAKHAITETIHEMNLSTSETVNRPETVQFIPSRGRKCVKHWGMARKTKSFLEVSKVDNHTTQFIEDLRSDGVNLKERQSEEDDDKISCLSSAGSIVEHRSNSRLPDIQSGSVRDRGSIKNSSYRLPGIGKYDIAQDDPIFEITPPGFDSRYNDVLVVEERESETPPPDIRQRAIDKCAEWLSKYNK
ncbi:hypothetical protein ACF0H5_018454 [Mactra antiquata]